MVFGLGKRGQGAFEYILMLAGLMLVVLLILVVLSSSSGSSSKDTLTKQCYAELQRAIACRSADGSFNSAGNPGANLEPCASYGYEISDCDNAAGLMNCHKIDAAKDWACSDLPANVQ
ncbi:MAG: hypothetical protein WC792_05695 [Candidatus Micrarchaeia archaeon]